MRLFGIMAGAALVALVPGLASAQTGAPMAPQTGAQAGAPMQPGGWSQDGWQAGAGARQGYRQGYEQAQRGYDERMRMDRRDYRRLSRGKRLPDAYLDPRYTVVDWADWGFAPPGPGMHWVRYYDDSLLVDDRGRVVDALYGVDWDHHGGRRGFGPGPRGFGPGGYGPGPMPGYGRGFGPGGMGGAGYPPPGVSTFRAGPNTVVTTAVVPTPPPVIVGGAYGGATVVAVTPGVAVTTTTTTTDYETIYKSAAVRQRVWRRPIRHVRPRCVHTTSCPVLGS